MTLSLLQLAQALELEYRGDASMEIGNAASIESAVAGDLCFIQQRKYLPLLDGSQCSAVIAPAEIAVEVNGKGILISDIKRITL